ncbi:uncharacterized protein [Tursiops truncatus]|uniref:uncharacterized protein n=1 Tax=Tursiops truncatus TaxID=9739 RepID=UPI003CCF7E20
MLTIPEAEGGVNQVLPPGPQERETLTRSVAGRGCGDAGAASLPAGPPPSAAAGPRGAVLPPAWEPGPVPGAQEGFLGGTRGPGLGAAERAAPREPGPARARGDHLLGGVSTSGCVSGSPAAPGAPRRSAPPAQEESGRRAAEGGPAAAPAGPCTGVPTAGGRRASSRLPLNRQGGRGAQQTRFPRGAHAQAAPAPGSRSLSPSLPPCLLPPLSALRIPRSASPCGLFGTPPLPCTKRLRKKAAVETHHGSGELVSKGLEVGG